MDRISVEFGDSDLPPSPQAGGSDSTTSVCNVVAQACSEIRGTKGVGELANCGMNAAVANAVLNATGKRIRDLPIRLKMLL